MFKYKHLLVSSLHCAFKISWAGSIKSQESISCNNITLIKKYSNFTCAKLPVCVLTVLQTTILYPMIDGFDHQYRFQY